MRLTAPMRTALQHAARDPLRRLHKPGPGNPEWPEHPTTLHALVRHGLLHRQELVNRHRVPVTVWTITQAGRDALKPREIFRREPSVYLAHPNADINGDWTTDPRRRIDPLPVIDADSLKEAWAQLSEERRLATQNRRDIARRIARNLRAA